MSLGRSLSLIATLLTAALLAVAVMVAPNGGWASIPAGYWVAGTIILVGSLLVGGLVYLFVHQRADKDIDRLRRYVESAKDPELTASTYEPRRWSRHLYESFVTYMSDCRSRIEQLNVRRRELEIQNRICEAERNHIEAILHSITDAVVVTDAFNELTIANESAANVLQFDAEHVKHQPIDRILSDPTLVKMIKDTRESGSPHNRRHIEHRLSTSGRPEVFDISLSCVSNDQQEVMGVVTVMRDVTREKEIAEMKSDFVSGVSHELRTPLSSIKAYVEMLVDGEVDDEQTRSEFYNIIQSEANRLSRLIDNILNISRIESGIVRVQREDISLSRIVTELIDVMRPQARAKQIEIVEKNKPQYYSIYADKDMMCQAALNLLSNAIKYTPAGGRVTIDTRVDELKRTVTFSVSDTGVGIPQEAIPHLFDKFYRVADHKKIAKGTGLGLNLVKHIVETVHDGNVSVKSEVGKGSVFALTLPLSERTA